MTVETIETVVEARSLPTARQRRKSLLYEIGTVVALALLLLLVIPPILTGIGQGVRVNQLGRFLSLAIVALGIDLIWGYTGLLSLGHGVFFALGGYALAMYLQFQGLSAGQIPEFFNLYGVNQLPLFWEPFRSFPFTVLAVFAVPTIVAAVLGYLVFRNRIRGVYFSILTQAALIVFFNFFNGQQKLINGTNGLKTDTSTIFGVQASDPKVQMVFYTLSVVFLFGGYGLCRWLTSGRLGRMLVAIRDDEPRVRFSGYNPTGFKVFVFAISAALAGVAGALYTVQSGIITPKAMDIAFSIEMVIWVAVGGRGTLIGAILGALIVNFAKTLLSEQFPAFWLFFQGALFLIVVTVLPSGILGWFRTDSVGFVRSLFGRPKVVETYPSLEEDLEVQYERENLRDRKSDG
ncbi:MAG: urea ABC transporter permease subunit UrtC [Kovacikia sp.]